jgi:hypothetical protein
MASAGNFISDKSNFFSNYNSESSSKDIKTQLLQINRQAADKTHSYLLQNLHLLEKEFSTLFRSLLQNPEDKEKFWLYAYYCARQLEAFYRSYDKFNQAQALNEQAQQILERLGLQRTSSSGSIDKKEIKNEPGFIEKIYNSIVAGFKDAIAIVTKTSVAKEKVVYVNMLRMLYMTARLTLLNLVIVFNDTGLLRQFNTIFNQNLSLEILQKRLGMLQGVSNILSVALFAMRGLIDTALIIKHTAFPSEEEKKSTWTERLQFELLKRHGSQLNDLLWSAVNLFTNFPQILGLGSPAIIATTVVFLLFDLSLLLWLWQLEEKKFKQKKQEFDIQINALTAKKSLSEEESNALKILIQQQRFLELDHKTSNASFQMNCAAAFLLMSGFAVGFVVATPLASVASFMVCVLAVSFYWSSSSYKTMMYNKERLQLIETSGGDYQAALKEYNQSRNQFAINLIKYAVMPTLLMGVMVVCWQAALALIVAYGVYECAQQLSAKKDSVPEAQMLCPLAA